MTPEHLGNLGLKTMANEFPVVSAFVIKGDNNLPALNW
jgi:DNA polymerase epsilon subunit 1